MPRLIVTKGADEGKQFELTTEMLSVGRDANNRIRLHDTEVSRRHAEFVRTPDGYRVVDVGSANGTFVNDRAIRDVLLQSGDQIQVGQSILVYAAGRGDNPAGSDLAERISIITRQDMELSSAIIKTIGEAEGSRILTRPEKSDVPFLRANLGIIYEAIQAVSHILDLNQLLERILELIFRALDADRGCILLRDTPPPEVSQAPEGGETSPGGHWGDNRSPHTPSQDEFHPKAVRWRDGRSADGSRPEKIPVSRTIMECVLREKQGMLVSDAARDDRFNAVQSIVRYGIREIICVPMRGRHETLGILYLDSLTPRPAGEGPPFLANLAPIGKFNSDHLALAIALAHQAALAVEETRYYQALVQAERLAAVGQTVAALSHHIKNILQGLRSGGEILTMGLEALNVCAQDGTSLPSKDLVLLQRGWRIVEKNQAKIYELVMDMLSYSKEREPNLEETDLNGVARDVLELLADRGRELGVKLDANLADNVPICSADREGVHRALLNVVSNALDAVEEAETPRVLLATVLEADQQWVQLRVTDNGTGIPPEKMGEIFRPFVQHQGCPGHRPGVGGQPKNPARTRRRHSRAEPVWPGQHLYPPAADSQNERWVPLSNPDP